MSAREKLGKRAQAQKTKVLVLAKIKAKKDLLFGTSSGKLTKLDKVKCWKEICDYCHAIGAILANRDYVYLRDIWWPNVKKLTLNKFDNSKAKCTALEKGKELTEVDRHVLNIMGKDWPTFEGLNSSELIEVVFEGPIFESQEDRMADSADEVEEPRICATRATSKTRSLSPSESQTSSKHFKLKSTFHKEQGDATDRAKRELQVKLLRLQVYQTQLQCRKLEIEMGMTQSSLTKDIQDSVSSFDNKEHDEDNENINIYHDSNAISEM